MQEAYQQLLNIREKNNPKSKETQAYEKLLERREELQKEKQAATQTAPTEPITQPETPAPIDRRVSLAVFSALVPLVASYNIDQIMAIDAATNIKKFLKKLTEKLDTLQKPDQQVFLRSTALKQQPWAQDLFDKLQIIYSFCNSKIQEKSEATFNTMFKNNKTNLKQLCNHYFSYQLVE